MSKNKKAIIKIYLYTLSVGFIYLAIIRLTGFSLPCIIYEITGIRCASCGTTRMFVELSKLNFSKAISYNPMMFFLLCVWLFISLMILCDIKLFQKKQFLFIMGLVSVFLLTAFGAYRIFW